MKITVDDIMNQNPCCDYTRELVEELWNGRESLTLMEISELNISVEDRIWAISRFMSDRKNRLFAADCAERLVGNIENEDVKEQINGLINAVRDCANGLITVDKLAAYMAAYSAAEREWQINKLREYIMEVERI